MIHVKICGVTTPQDAVLCVDAGASAIGINFVPGTARFVDRATGRAIVDAVGGRALTVGVVANMMDIMAFREELRLGCLQLHGDEPPEALLPLLPHAYKAIRVATDEDVARAELYAGEHVLVDTKVDGLIGGTGKTFEWSLVRSLARARKLTLAGGLTPGNVKAAILAVNPYCVDVASGVEVYPRKKDERLVRAFMDACAV
jgi:phosphoribosylanthranilate isomerase